MNPNAYSVAARGLRAFPLIRGGKSPMFQGWQQSATSDPLDAMELIPEGANIGVATSGLFVLDVDAGKGGLEEYARLCSLGVMPETFTVRSARGGLHVYFQPPAGQTFATRAYRVMPDGREIFALQGYAGIDVRAEGGLIVGPGSTFEGKPYAVEVDAPIAEMPPWLAALAKAAMPKLVDRVVSIGDLDTPNAKARVVEYLKTAEPSIEGNAGDHHCIAVANMVLDEGVTVETAIELMAEYWDHRCSPPWEDRLDYKVRSAAKSRQEPIGSKNWDNAFGAVEILPPPAPTPVGIVADPTAGDTIFKGTAARWLGKEPEPARFVVGNIAPCGAVTLLVSAGGRGKSMLAMQMMTCVAAGIDFLGFPVEPGSAAGIFCEDADAELHRRQKAICGALDIPFGEVAGSLFTESFVGRDAILWTEKGATALLVQLERAIAARPGLRLLVLDGVSHVFAASEFDRGQVTRFLSSLNAIASRHEFAVILIAHESKSSASTDTHAASGSTGWLNHTRSVLKLEIADGAPGLRVLRHIKTNYGELAGPTTCALNGGAFASLSGNQQRRSDCQRLTLQLLAGAIRAGENIAVKKGAKAYAPKWLCTHPENTGFGEQEFEQAVRDLDGMSIRRETYKSGSKSPQRWALCNAELPGGTPGRSADASGSDGSGTVEQTSVLAPNDGHLVGKDGS